MLTSDKIVITDGGSCLVDIQSKKYNINLQFESYLTADNRQIKFNGLTIIKNLLAKRVIQYLNHVKI
jgi:hypothetical protein